MSPVQRASSAHDLIRVTAVQAKRLKVLVVDAAPIRREGLKAVLQATPDMTVVGEAASLAEAVKAARRLAPHVIVTNIELPDGRADIAWASISRTNDHARALILADKVDDDAVLAGLAAGVNGYLLHDVAADVLTGAIRLIAARVAVADENATRSLARSVTAIGAAHRRSLSRQEQRVLELVAQGRTNKQIATALRLSPLTVKNYLASIFQKLHVSRRSEAAAICANLSRGPRRPRA